MDAVYWTIEDFDSGRCRADELGKPRPLVEVVDAVQLDNSPEAMARVGISTLMRLAQQSNDLPTAFKAAMALVERALGRIPFPVQALPPAPEPPKAPDEPWLERDKRYTPPHDALPEQRAPSDPALPLAQPSIAAPVIARDPPAPPPAPKVPSQPLFWASPHEPAGQN